MDSKTKYIIDWIKKYFNENGDANTKAVIGISGGKDSTIAAALCVEALGKDRVVGVLMPQGEQRDIDDSRRVCELLDIKSYTINIGDVCSMLYEDFVNNTNLPLTNQVTTNAPARIRMNVLYMVAAAVGGRVCNTSNRSEIFVGYSTKWGDGVGDFGPLRDLTVGEVLMIGHDLGLPADLVDKTPEDGMSGLSDEENMGVSYADIDNYILGYSERVSPEARQLISSRHLAAAHKNNAQRIKHPRVIDYYRINFKGLS